MAVAGILCFTFSARLPLVATHAIIAMTAAGTGLLIYEAGVAVGQYGSIFVWTMLICGYYFPRRVALAHPKAAQGQRIVIPGLWSILLAPPGRRPSVSWRNPKPQR